MRVCAYLFHAECKLLRHGIYNLDARLLNLDAMCTNFRVSIIFPNSCSCTILVHACIIKLLIFCIDNFNVCARPTPCILYHAWLKHSSLAILVLCIALRIKHHSLSIGLVLIHFHYGIQRINWSWSISTRYARRTFSTVCYATCRPLDWTCGRPGCKCS